MTDHHHAAGDAHGSHDHGSHDNSKYIYVFIALCVLTSISFMSYAPWWPFPKPITWLMMMAVSCAKASLVMLVFMHLWWEADWKYVLTIPASIMSIFLALALIPDIGRRVGNENTLYHYSDSRLRYVADEGDAHRLVEASRVNHEKAGAQDGVPAAPH